MDRGMWYTLLTFDCSLFMIINSTLHTRGLDYFMPFITSIDNFRSLLILAGSIFFLWGGKKERTILVLALILLGLSDFVSSHVLKDFFYRARPCITFSSVRLLANCTSSFSFPSSHVVNTTAQVVLFSFFYPRLRFPLYCLAVLVAYSRVYVGVHYPADVIGGMIFGSVLPCGLFGIGKLLRRAAEKTFWNGWESKTMVLLLQFFFRKREGWCKEKAKWVREA